MADNKLSSITFIEGAFDSEGSRSDLRESAPFTAAINEWNGLVSKLDRVDQFENLSIRPDTYSQTSVEVAENEFIEYGVPHISRHDQFDGSPILPHQRTSSLNFLQKLRGFGLLADIVGSGKTFEAGVVLSELAMRGLVSSVLFIVPDQVYGDWVSTMEKTFGLGKWNGLSVQDPQESKTPVVLQKVGPSFRGGDFEERDGYECPKRPMIVTMEDFANSDISVLNNKLFDVVVVDEAHNLSVESGKYSRAMAMLSTLMKTKIAAGKSYCLLLSATPHKGNLADMFRLWYFIRCKGGTPQDFLANGYRSARYESEHDFYFNSICRGATTVADFVRKEKISVLRGGDADFCKEFAKFFRSRGYELDFDQMPEDQKNESLERFFVEHYKDRSNSDITMAKDYIKRYYGDVASRPDIRQKFAKYLKEEGKNDFDFFYEGMKEKYINEFLRRESLLGDQVKKIIARAYHHGVLRSIMIRQPKSKVASAASKMRSVNLYYFRTDVKEKTETPIYIPGVAGEEGIIVRPNPDSANFLAEENAITPTDAKGNPVNNAWGKELNYSLAKYVERLAKGTYDGYEGFSYEKIYAEIVARIMKEFGLSDEDYLKAFKKNENTNELTDESKYHFLRKSSVSFYKEQIAACSFFGGEASFTFEPVYVSDNEDTFRLDYKYNKLKQILRAHQNERVIVFFDYDASDENKVGDEIYRRLVEDTEFRSRIIDISDIQKVRSIFDSEENRNGVLVATDRELTEGANLQKCNVVVNFQITPNPLEMQQRIGRVFRIGQDQDVLIYSIADLFALEGYVLAYFNRIGLISSDNSGDAEILAGCNNENMVTVRCPKTGCGNIQLFSKEDFEGHDSMLCTHCGDGHMELMIDRNIKCTDPSQRCNAIMTRSSGNANMYRCVYGGGTLCNDGKSQDRTYYCPKICVMSHCPRFEIYRTGERKGKCKALNIFENEGGTTPKLAKACEGCEYKAECDKFGCTYGDGADAIKSCMTCRFSTGLGSPCRPHIINFDRNWEADCPKCKRHKIAPVKRNNFEAFIRGLFDFTYDGGAAFCDAFRGEIEKVSDIQEILRADDSTEEVNY